MHGVVKFLYSYIKLFSVKYPAKYCSISHQYINQLMFFSLNSACRFQHFISKQDFSINFEIVRDIFLTCTSPSVLTE